MDIKIAIWDIETIRELGIYGFYLPEEDQWFPFEISKRRNDMFAIARFCERLEREGYYLVGYNSLGFDAQVLEFLLRNHENWYDKTALEVTNRLWRKAQDIIDDQSHGLFPPYREEQLLNKHIDLLRIHHFDNINKRTSLKWLEFMMDLENIEEMPYDHAEYEVVNGYRSPINRDFTEEQIEDMLYYWRNDIHATKRWYEYTTGQVEHEEYRGKNMIEDRLSLIEEFKLDPRFLNYSDVKIGDELNKIGYCTRKRINIKDVNDLKKKRRPTGNITFGQCIPDYVEFETPVMQKFLDDVKTKKVSLSKDGTEYPLLFGHPDKEKREWTKYMIAQGGIHTCESNRIIVPTANQRLRDADVGSQYPCAIIKRRLYPSHLGPEWLVNYEDRCMIRLNVYKPLSKENTPEGRRAKGVEGMIKLQLNGGGFGKTNERTNWQYDPKVTFKCTIGNEFEILMLIERMEITGIKVVSANTDGILCLYDKSLEDVYMANCAWWEEKVGNTVLGKLEFTDFSAIYQESVNTYIAIKEKDGKAKVKGRLGHEVFMHKNNTRDIGRIERKAIVEFFSKGTPVEETIRASRSLFDFGIGLKGTANYRYESYDPITGAKETYKRVIRYYYTKDGNRLLKVKNEGSEAKGNDITRIGGENQVKIFNRYQQKPMEEYGIDYDYYINNAQSIVDKLTAGKKVTKKVDKNQLSMF